MVTIYKCLNPKEEQGLFGGDIINRIKLYKGLNIRFFLTARSIELRNRLPQGIETLLLGILKAGQDKTPKNIFEEQILDLLKWGKGDFRLSLIIQ